MVLRDACWYRGTENHIQRWESFEVGLIVARQNGKGSILEALELAHLFLWNSRLLLHSAHQFNTATEHFLRIASLIENSDMLRRRCKRPKTAHGEEQIETRSGNRLRFVARSRKSARGFTGDLVIMDEAFNLDADAMAAMMPAMSAVPNPQIWYTSSAPLLDSTHLMRVQERGRAGNERSLTYFEWSAPAEARNDLDNTDYWCQANPALGVRIHPEIVRAERVALDDDSFARERLGIGDQEGQPSVIPLGLWRACKQTDLAARPGKPLIISVDADPTRTYWTIGLAGVLPDGKIQVEVVDHHEGQGWVVPRLVELRARWKPAEVIVDAGAPAASLIPDLEQARITPLCPTVGDIAAGCGAFFDAAIEGTLRHLGQDELELALRGAGQRELADRWAWSRRKSTVDITPLVAVTLAHWGVQRTLARKRSILESVW
jgi:hypothetical protein